jgi:hypothetical protein
MQLKRTPDQDGSPAETKRRWSTPRLTAYGKVPEEGQPRAALGS